MKTCCCVFNLIIGRKKKLNVYRCRNRSGKKKKEVEGFSTKYSQPNWILSNKSCKYNAHFKDKTKQKRKTNNAAGTISWWQALFSFCFLVSADFPTMIMQIITNCIRKKRRRKKIRMMHKTKAKEVDPLQGVGYKPLHLVQ